MRAALPAELRIYIAQSMFVGFVCVVNEKKKSQAPRFRDYEVLAIAKKGTAP